MSGVRVPHCPPNFPWHLSHGAHAQIKIRTWPPASSSTQTTSASRLGVNRAIIQQLHQCRRPHLRNPHGHRATLSTTPSPSPIANPGPRCRLPCRPHRRHPRLAPPESIPSLMGSDGKQLSHQSLLDFVREVLLRGNIRESEIEREADGPGSEASAGRHRTSPISTPTNIPTSFLHVTRPLLRVAESQLHTVPSATPSNRSGAAPSEPGKAACAAFSCTLLDQPSATNSGPSHQIRSSVRSSPSEGISGRLRHRPARFQIPHARSLLRSLMVTWELVCHPGYNDSELNTITTRLRARSRRRTRSPSQRCSTLCGATKPSRTHPLMRNLDFFGLQLERGIHTSDTGFDHA